MKYFPRQRALLLTAFFGTVVCIILLYHHVSLSSGYQTGPSLCAISEGFDCDKVAGSEFAELFGVPLASYGLLFFLAFTAFLALASIGKDKGEGEEKASAGQKVGLTVMSSRAFYSVAVACSGASVAASIVYGAISYFIIETVCLYCSGIYLASVFLALLLWSFPDKPEALMPAFFRGVRTILAFFSQGVLFPQSYKASTLVSRLAVLSLMLTALLLLSAPSYLEAKVFKVHDRQAQIEKLAKEAFIIWQKAKPYSLEINLSSDPLTRDFVYGAMDAEITIVEFSDFRCPYCNQAQKELKKVVDRYPNTRLVFKNYPLDQECNRELQHQMHPFACRAARMARCAGMEGQEFFWEMHDALFALREFSEETLSALPLQLGLSEQPFEQCLNDPVVHEKVLYDVKEANRLKLTGTPSIFVNGRILQSLSQETFELVIGSLAH